MSDKQATYEDMSRFLGEGKDFWKGFMFASIACLLLVLFVELMHPSKHNLPQNSLESQKVSQ